MANFVGKRRFFSEPSPAQVKNKARGLTDIHSTPEELIELLEGTSADTVFRLTNCIDGDPIMPREHYEGAYGGPYPVDGLAGKVSWHFLRHGPEASMTQFKSERELRQALEKLRMSPRDNLPPDVAVSQLSNIFYFFIDQCNAAYKRAFDRGDTKLSGSTWKPILGNDRRIRKVFLTELLEAALLTFYCSQDERLAIQIGKAYDDSKGVLRDGSIITVDRVPSRTEGVSPYSFDFESFAMAYNSLRHIIAYSLGSTLDNHPEKRNLRRQFRGGKGAKSRRDPNVLFFVAQEIAAYWQQMQNFYNLPIEDLRKVNRRQNINPRFARIVPLEMCPFRVPNQDVIDMYIHLLERVIVAYRDGRGKIKDRKLVKGEQEIYLSELVRRAEWGIWDTFYLHDQKMQDLSWANKSMG